MEHTVKRFKQTDNIKNHAKLGRPTTASHDKALNVLLSFEDPQFYSR